jgi:hypothetical protein
MIKLSGACVLLGGTYAVWLGLQRRIRAQEQSRKLQVWEAEGGSPRETTSEPGKMQSTADRRAHGRR